MSQSAYAKSRWRVLSFDVLEDRRLLSVAPATHFAALNFGDTAGYIPPDTNAAAGTNHVIEAVNTTLGVYDKNGNLLSKPDLGTFFGTPTDSLSDPVITYDDISGKFFLAVLDITTDNLLYARFSDTTTGDPTQAGVETGAVHVTDTGGSSGVTVGDYPRVGWNNDAYFVSLNMFDAVYGVYDHVRLVTIPKQPTPTASFQNPMQLDPFGTGDTSGNNFTLAPAAMHGATTVGGPMYFVDEAGYGNGNTIRVVKETNPSTAPLFTSYLINVPAYVGPPVGPPAATQPGPAGTATLETNDTRILNVEWRNNTLAAAQTVGLSTDRQAHARWYEFSTAATPALVQQGTIGAGTGTNSYFPSVAIDPAGDLGMTFIESSTGQYVSMAVTGATYSSTPFAMTMQTPVVSAAGQATYAAFDGSPTRAGDFSGMSVDPSNGTFWAANEYATNNTSLAANWGTNITNFFLTAAPAVTHDVAVTAITASPASVVLGGSTTIAVTVANLGASPETFTVRMTDRAPAVRRPVAATLTPSRFTVTNLAPGATQTFYVKFATTSVTTRGTHTVTATASLAGDANTANNSLSTTVSVMLSTTRTRTGRAFAPVQFIYRDHPALPGQPLPSDPTPGRSFFGAGRSSALAVDASLGDALFVQSLPQTHRKA